MHRISNFSSIDQVETIKNFTIEMQLDKVKLGNIKEYDLIFNVSDMYNFTEYYFSIQLIDVTPLDKNLD